MMTAATLTAHLVAPTIVEREEANLLRAWEAVEHFRRELTRLTEEAQVLTLRVHVIHGSESTAVLRLLYRKESQADSR